MSHEEDVEVYRSQLLESLNSRPSRSTRDTSDPIQVYVNERRVGVLEGANIGATLHVQSLERIETVQLRTEEGSLLGGLAAPEYGFRTDRVRLSSDVVELCVHNTAQGGSLSAVFVPAPSFWSQAWKGFAAVVDTLAVRRSNATVAPGMRNLAFAQVVLVILIGGLVTDRMTGWMTPEQVSMPVAQEEVSPPASLAQVAKLEQQLDELARMQAKVGEALGSHQKGMAQLQQAMVKLSSTQDSVESSVLTVRQELERQQATSREVERVVHQPSNKAQMRHGQIEAAIRTLTVDNDRLSKEVAGLEQYNQDLKNKLLAAGLGASKGSDVNPDKLLARQAEVMQPAQQAVQNGQSQPFLFWVTFSEGTSQESIDQWLNEMKGHKGAVNEGWQEVRIVPPAVPPDRFLEQIRGEKIVKAARITQ
ncbi:MAG: hypothetical protein H8K04_00840 [Nitrospira sp.]